MLVVLWYIALAYVLFGAFYAFQLVWNRTGRTGPIPRKEWLSTAVGALIVILLSPFVVRWQRQDRATPKPDLKVVN